MILKRNSFFVRVAYLFTPTENIPSQTSLCAVFWRSILASILPILVASFLLSVLIVEVLSNWLQVLTFFAVVIGGAAAFIAIVVGGVFITDELPEKLRLAEHDGMLPPFVVGALAAKRKICPIVRIVE